MSIRAPALHRTVESTPTGESIPPPIGLRSSPFEQDDERYVVFSYPLEPTSAPEELTDAEVGVALLAIRGLSNAQIAFVRDTTTRTVANQLASIYRKLRVGSRVELAARLATR